MKSTERELSGYMRNRNGVRLIGHGRLFPKKCPELIKISCKRDMDSQTDTHITKLRFAFRNFAKAPE